MELQTEDVTLHYDDDGDPGAPPVLVLHGITQSTATWSWLVPHLAGAHRVVRLDFRGHGRSARAPGTYRFDGYVADATAVCEQVLGQPAVVVGHSLGGGTAAALAQLRPELVRGVVLEDPAIFAPPAPATAGADGTDPAASPGGSGLEGNALLDGFRLLRESIPRLQASGLSATDLAGVLAQAPSPAGPAFGELAHDDALTAMAEGMLLLDATVLDPIFDGSAEPLFDPRRALPVPGILLAADPAVPGALVRPDVVALLEEHSPMLECRTVVGAGHMIHDSTEHRTQVLDAVQELIART